jgi:hypothetical protein
MTVFLRPNIEKHFRICGSQQPRPFLYEGNKVIITLYYTDRVAHRLSLCCRHVGSREAILRRSVVLRSPYDHFRDHITIAFSPFYITDILFQFVLSNSSCRYSVTQCPMSHYTARCVNRSSASGMLTSCVSWSASLWQSAAGSPTSESPTFHFVSVVITTQYFVLKR